MRFLIGNNGFRGSVNARVIKVAKKVAKIPTEREECFIY